MKQVSDPFWQYLQQGIAETFRIIQLVWTWSSDQIVKVTQTPWEHWPLWKQILLFIVVAAVAYALLIAAMQLWTAALNVLSAFATFVGTVIVTLPTILIAGFIALAGMWVINNFHDLSSLRSLITFQGSNIWPAYESGAAQSGGAIRQDTIRQDTIRQDTIRQDTIRQDTIRQDTTRQDTSGSIDSK